MTNSNKHCSVQHPNDSFFSYIESTTNTSQHNLIINIFNDKLLDKISADQFTFYLQIKLKIKMALIFRHERNNSRVYDKFLVH